MRLVGTNDLHYDKHNAQRIEQVFADMAEAKPDVITIAGDHTGDHPDSPRLVFELARKHYDGPIIACLGNHDYWVHEKCKDQETMTAEFEKTMRQAVQAAEDNNIHLLEEHGVWTHPEHYGICVLGHGGWYYRNHRNSNDYSYLPRKYQGVEINQWMNDRAIREVRKQITTLTEDDWTRVAMTHMPVTHMGIGEWQHFGEEQLGDLLLEAGCKKFIHGHMHEKKNGPNRYESGSNGYQPQFFIMEVI